MFPRYGSYPGLPPSAALSTTFHTQVVGANGYRRMFIERVEGLRGHPAQLPPVAAGRDDRLQRLGHERQPDRDGHGRRRRSSPVIAVTSVAESWAATGHPSGTGCSIHADVGVDLGTLIGDALVSIDGLETPVGLGSSVAGVAVVNEIKVRTAGLLVARGGMPPVLTSGSVVTTRSPRVCSTRRTTSTRRLARALTEGVNSREATQKDAGGILIAAVSLAAAACGGGGGGEALSGGAGSGKTDNFVIGVSNTLAATAGASR